MVRYHPYQGDTVIPEGITLQEYAECWIDMVPHTGHLTELASRVKTIVEFGLRGGVSTWAFLDGLPEDGTLLGIDILNVDEILLPPRVKEDPRFTFVMGDDREVKLPKTADLVMIDSSHLYEHTVQELIIAEKMKPRYIVLHDYLDPGAGPMVKPAVDGFVAYRSYKWEVLHESPWGLAVLVPK